MYRVFFVIVLSMTCATSLAVGADIPSLVARKSAPALKKPPLKQSSLKLSVPLKKAALKLTKTSVRLQPSAVVPKKTETAIKVTKPALPEIKTAPAVPETTIANLSWVLNPLVANADGGKNEGSASQTGYIVVEKPGTICDSEMTINLEGHIVKTVNSTVRLDIQVGKFKRSVVWKPDEIQSGAFNITLKEKGQDCVLGDYISASALAFVTKEGDGHVAMVSLEKIVLRYESPLITGSQ